METLRLICRSHQREIRGSHLVKSVLVSINIISVKMGHSFFSCAFSVLHFFFFFFPSMNLCQNMFRYTMPRIHSVQAACSNQQYVSKGKTYVTEMRSGSIAWVKCCINWVAGLCRVHCASKGWPAPEELLQYGRSRTHCHWFQWTGPESLKGKVFWLLGFGNIQVPHLSLGFICHGEFECLYMGAKLPYTLCSSDWHQRITGIDIRLIQ